MLFEVIIRMKGGQVKKIMNHQSNQFHHNNNNNNNKQMMIMSMNPLPIPVPLHMNRLGGGGGGYGLWPPNQQEQTTNSNRNIPKEIPVVGSKRLVQQKNWNWKKGNFSISIKRKDFKRRKGKPMIPRNHRDGGGGGGYKLPMIASAYKPMIAAAGRRAIDSNIASGYKPTVAGGDDANTTGGYNSTVAGGGGYKPMIYGGGGGYKNAVVNELMLQQNRLNNQKNFEKKKFNKSSSSRFAPYAPRNTSSFIMRAKKSGGIASSVSPSPVSTPWVLPTPMFSPSRQVLVDMAEEEWGVDGYGSMKGLIRLRSPPANAVLEDDEGGSISSDLDVEEQHLEVERRLDNDLSRFEMVYPNCGDQEDMHNVKVKQEKLSLKERLSTMERELCDLRTRLLSLERKNHHQIVVDEEASENDYEDDSGSREGYSNSMEENNEVVSEEINERGDDKVVEEKEDNNSVDVEVKDVNDVEVKQEHSNNEKVEVAKRVNEALPINLMALEFNENEEFVGDACIEEGATKQD